MKIAVYGTLRQGNSANRKMAGCTFVSTTTVKGQLYNLGWYPGLILGDDHSPSVVDRTLAVAVEVYEAPQDTLEASKVLTQLDTYEGYSASSPEHSLYLRKPVFTEDGQEVFIYEYNHPVSEDQLIPSGDWMNK